MARPAFQMFEGAMKRLNGRTKRMYGSEGYFLRQIRYKQKEVQEPTVIKLVTRLRSKHMHSEGTGQEAKPRQQKQFRGRKEMLLE
jgi:hypothetical protein